ncbi:MAG: indolepyruvate ferredoxin oxidoreductase subunit alpha [Defluviitaleaceae bacterium]|nr:indolepyruvate ferredoxin oxidoreductase subunit alpha [Defluviitaleaceae bacterium]
MKVLLTGDEALARGAYEAGVTFASAYPGTPSTEILQNLTTYEGIFAEWAPNEKVALEAVIGASIAGARAVASMKHVGVNVAADPLFTFAYTGVNGGMVLISADEPGQHSSQNEQDNRYYAQSAKIPMLEPSDSQECIDMMKAAYEISEKFDTPVMVRITTRIAHSKSPVALSDRIEVPFKEYQKDPAKYLMVPLMSVKRRVILEERLKSLKDFTESTELNYIEKGGKIGVIASGMCVNFAKEIFGDTATYLKLGATYPLPDKLLDEFMSQVDKVYIIEENDPYLEHWVQRCGYECIGKDIIPPLGEMTPDVLRKAIFGQELEGLAYDKSLVAPRPPVLCAGCPHRGFFYELAKKKDTLVAGDIGCYTLGFAPPFNAMDYLICMGAAFSAGHGSQIALNAAGKDTRVVGVMGDSTFFHMGIPGLIEILYNESNTICVILDNRTTGMTGHQEHPGTGRNAYLKPAPEIDIEAVARSLGAKNVATVDPNDIKAVREVLNDAYSKNEPYVIITRWPCVLKPLSEGDYKEYGQDLFKKKYMVDTEDCIGCKACIRAGCPPISVMDKKANINTEMCMGCGVCAQICPKTAIKLVEEGM